MSNRYLFNLVYYFIECILICQVTYGPPCIIGLHVVSLSRVGGYLIVPPALAMSYLKFVKFALVLIIKTPYFFISSICLSAMLIFMTLDKSVLKQKHILYF